MAEQTKKVAATLTLAEHTRLKRVCLAQKPPAKLQDFIRGLILRAISPERAA